MELVLDAGAELAEGPCWLAERERLCWVDILAGGVHLLDPATGNDVSFSVGQPVGAAVPTANGKLALAAGEGYLLLDLATGLTDLLADVEKAIPANRMNDGKCDSAGRFWAGTMAMDQRPGAGALYRLDTDGSVGTMITGTGISNGIDWSPDDRMMYYVDSLERRVDVFDFDAMSGAISNRRAFACIEAPGAPDGLTVDAEGGVWLAIWGAGEVVHYLPDGTLVDRLEVPVSQPSSCCFGGRDLRDLYITTAWESLSTKQRAAQPRAGGIFRCRPGVEGRLTRPYRGHRSD